MNTSSSHRTWVGRMAAILVASLIATLGISTPSEAATSEAGWIEGSVRDESGLPLAGQPLTVTRVDPSTGDAWNWERYGTFFDGTFRVRVAPGSYRILFGDTRLGYAQEVWRNRNAFNYNFSTLDPRDLPDLIVVTAGETVHGIDAVIGRGGAITGRIVPAGASTLRSAADFAGARAELIIFDTARRIWSRTGFWGRVNSDGSYWLGSAETDRLVVGTLYPGRYRVAIDYVGPRGRATASSGDIVVRAGNVSTFSATLKPVPGQPPKLVNTPWVENSASPALVAPIGTLWTAGTGLWEYPDGSIRPGGQPVTWLRCDRVVHLPSVRIPPGCTIIFDTNASRYRSTEADAGKYITIWAHAAAPYGGTALFAYAVGSATVRTENLVAPSMTRAPSVTSNGTAVGSTLTLDAGEWSGAGRPIVTQAWMRCTSPVTVAAASVPRGCVGIPGARGVTYRTTIADAGKFVTVQVAARNGAGVLRTVVPTTTALDPLRSPTLSTPPGLTGSGVGTTWNLDVGGWTGNPAPVVTQA